MKMEHPAVVHREDLGAAICQVPCEAAGRHPVDVHGHGRGRARTGAHRLALLAQQGRVGRERDLVGGRHARRDVVDLGKVNRRRLVGESRSTRSREGRRASDAREYAGDPHWSSSSARRRGTDVLAGLTPTLSA